MSIGTSPTARRGDWKRLTLYFLLTTTLFTAGTATFTLTGLTAGPVPPVPIALLGASVGGVVFGATMTWFFAVMDRRSGGFSTARLITKSLQKKTLPDGIDPAEWGKILDRQEVSAKRGRWLYPLTFGLFAALELSQALQGPVIFWVFTAFFIAMAVFSPFSMNRQLARIHLLRNQLLDRLDPGAEQDAASSKSSPASGIDY